MNVSLRPWHKDDAAAIAEMLNNKNILDNLRDGIPFPYTLQDAFNFLNVFGLQQPKYFFCIEVDGQVGGSISILAQKDVYRITAEIGYYLAEKFWNQGILSQVIILITEYTWQNLPDIKKLYAEIFWFNKASMRVLEKSGFHLEGIRKNHVIKNGIIGDDYLWVKFKP